VECLCEGAQIEVRVTDHTSGFAWPRRAQLPAQESESGRGVYLIQTLMDRANYFQAPGENILVLRIHRAPQPDREPPPAAADENELQRQLAENQRVVGNMVEELSSCYESLSAIFRYGGRQSQIGDLPAFAHRLLVDLLHITSADWFVLRLAPPGEARLAGCWPRPNRCSTWTRWPFPNRRKKRPGRIGSRSLALRGMVR